MKPVHLIYIILGLTTGHWGYLQAVELRPRLELWAAHKLVDEDLKQGSVLDKDRSLLLCLKQLEDWESRSKEAREILGQASLVSSDLVESKPK